MFRNLLLGLAAFVAVGSCAGAGIAGPPLEIAAPSTPAPAGSAHGTADPTAEERGFVGWLRRTLSSREPYALDDLPRRLAAGQEPVCLGDQLVVHRGETVRYRGAVRVHPAFVERLERFEQAVHDTAVEVYGRAPRRIQHAGTYSCRPVRGRDSRISEHALGNAIDVRGFEFGPLPRNAREAAPEDLPVSLRRGFTVTVGRHWGGNGRNGETHERFLHTLTERLERDRVFRGMIGPADPRHANHLHLDAGPYRYSWL
jgi:hypothetical protein